MIFGFNNEYPIIATAMSEDNDAKLIVHAVIGYEDKEDERQFYLYFQMLKSTTCTENEETYKEQLMRFICDNSNLKLIPWKIDNEYYSFSKGWEKSLGSKYALLPLNINQ